MRITIHRGTHSIGGAVTEIATQRARIIIDMGASLAPACGADGKFGIEGVTRGEPACDAVLLTHYHGDHVGLAGKILPQIPIYIGGTAKKILLTVQSALEAKLGAREDFAARSERIETFCRYSENKPLRFGDITVTPYSVDHSAFDAYMLLIEAEGKRVLHTGDFRMHGARGRKMPAVFYKYARGIDVLITEGTMLSREGERTFTEHELGSEAKKLLKENKYTFVLCSSTNIDTIAEFYSAAIANKRAFVVCEDGFQAEILRTVTENSRSPFYDFERRKTYVYGKNLHPYMESAGFCFLARANRVTRTAMSAFPNNLLVYSMWSGYLDSKRDAFDSHKSDFVRAAVENGSRFVSLHTSGHATAEALKRVCGITQAKTVIPIHGERPEAFRELAHGGEVLILNDGDSVTF